MVNSVPKKILGIDSNSDETDSRDNFNMMSIKKKK